MVRHCTLQTVGIAGSFVKPLSLTGTNNSINMPKQWTRQLLNINFSIHAPQLVLFAKFSNDNSTIVRNFSPAFDQWTIC